MGKLGQFLHDYSYASNDRYRKIYDQKEYGMIMDKMNDRLNVTQDPDAVINEMFNSKNPTAVAIATEQMTNQWAAQREIAKTRAGQTAGTSVTGDFWYKGVKYKTQVMRNGGIRVMGHDAGDDIKIEGPVGEQYIINASGGRDYLIPLGTDIIGATSANIQNPEQYSYRTPQGRRVRIDGSDELSADGGTATPRPKNTTGDPNKSTQIASAQRQEQADKLQQSKTYLDAPRKSVYRDDGNGNQLLVNPYKIPGHYKSTPWGMNLEEYLQFKDADTDQAKFAHTQNFYEYEKQKMEELPAKVSEFETDKREFIRQYDAAYDMNRRINVIVDNLTALGTGPHIPLAQALDSVTLAGKVLASGARALEPRYLKAHIDSLKAQIGMDMLIWLRGQSETGAGMGQVSDRDMDLLMNSMASLDQSLPPVQIATSLKVIDDIYRRKMNEYHDHLTNKHNYLMDPVAAPDGYEPYDGTAPTIEEQAEILERQFQEGWGDQGIGGLVSEIRSQMETGVRSKTDAIADAATILHNLGFSAELQDKGLIEGLALRLGLPVEEVKEFLRKDEERYQKFKQRAKETTGSVLGELMSPYSSR